MIIIIFALAVKSSLLNAILGEIEALTGSCKVAGKVAYASQEPWIFSGTIRQNVLCGQEYDSKRYNKVVKACALEKDFNLFPNGDSTLVGERGVSLSGGQKARVNLARALYIDADIYLLDDPLSAVDMHVGRHLFDKAINSYLRGKIRVLVTHQLQYLKDVDQILILKGVIQFYLKKNYLKVFFPMPFIQGRMEALGTFQELNSGGVDIAKTLEDEEAELEADNLSQSFLGSELEGSFTRNDFISMSSVRKRYRKSMRSIASIKEVLGIVFGYHLKMLYFFPFNDSQNTN